MQPRAEMIGKAALSHENNCLALAHRQLRAMLNVAVGNRIAQGKHAGFAGSVDDIDEPFRKATGKPRDAPPTDEKRACLQVCFAPKSRWLARLPA